MAEASTRTIWAVKTQRADGDICDFWFCSEKQYLAFCRIVRASTTLDVIEVLEKSTVEAWSALEMALEYDLDDGC